MAFIQQEQSSMKFLDWGKLGTYKDGKPHDSEEYIVLPDGNFYLDCTLDKVAEKADSLGYIVNTCKIYEGDPKVEKVGKLVEDIEEKIYIGNKAALYRQMIESDKPKFIPVKAGDHLRFQFTGMYKTDKGGQGYGINVFVERK